jgi:hypothetical protein
VIFSALIISCRCTTYLAAADSGAASWPAFLVWSSWISLVNLTAVAKSADDAGAEDASGGVLTIAPSGCCDESSPAEQPPSAKISKVATRTARLHPSIVLGFCCCSMSLIDYSGVGSGPEWRSPAGRVSARVHRAQIVIFG